MIKAENDLLGGFDHCALDFDQKCMGVRDSFESDSTGAHDGDIRVKFGECFSCDGAYQHAKSMIQNTTRKDDFDPVWSRKVVGNGH